MPLSYWLDRRHNLLWLICQGHIGLQDVGRFRETVRRDVGIDFDTIADIRGVTSSDITGEQLRQLARQHGLPEPRLARLAIVAKAHDQQFGRARIFELTANSQGEARGEVAVFTSVTDAMRWLGGCEQAEGQAAGY